MNKLFENGARVAFIGDSITCNGRAVARIQEYYRTHLPERRVKIYNLGISGDSAKGANERMDEILSVEPTEAVVMFGVNDMGIWYYGANPSDEDLSLRAERRLSHIEATVSLVKKLKELNIPVTLCSAVGRDEQTAGDCDTTGATEALLEFYHENLKAVDGDAIKNTVDYLTPLQSLLKDLTAIGGPMLFAEDRTHPTPLGQAIMARIFLAAQGLPVSIPTAELLAEGWQDRELSPEIAERWQTESLWRSLHFVYPHQKHLCGDIPLKERIAFFAERAKNTEPGYIRNQYENYVNNADKEDGYFAKYMELTDKLY